MAPKFIHAREDAVRWVVCGTVNWFAKKSDFSSYLLLLLNTERADRPATTVFGVYICLTL